MGIFSQLTLVELSELRAATKASSHDQLATAAQKGTAQFYSVVPRQGAIEISVPVEVYRAMMLDALDGEFVQRLISSTADSKVKQ